MERPSGAGTLADQGEQKCDRLSAASLPLAAHRLGRGRPWPRTRSSTSTTGRTISTTTSSTDFTKETGIKVVYDVYDNNEIVETKLLAGGSGYDIVVPTDSNIAAPDPGRHVHEARQVEAAEPRPHVAGDHRAAGRPTIRATSTPSTTCGAPPASATTSTRSRSACPTRRSTPGTCSSSRRSSSKFADCGIYVLDAPEDVIPSALNYLGLNPDSKDPADIEKAGELLQDDPALHPEVPLLRIHQRARQRRHLPGRRLFGRHPSGAATAPPKPRTASTIDYVIPKEGALMWFDSFVIPADAPHPGGGARLHQLHAEAGSRRRELELRLLRQRQHGLAAAARRGRDRRSGDLSRRGDARPAVHHRRPTTRRCSASSRASGRT